MLSAAADGLGIFELRRQMLEVVDLALGKLRDGLITPEGLELADEVVGQETQQPLGLLARLLGDRPGLTG
jgi:hypothetical protein